MLNQKLDRIDIRILTELQKNARLKNVELAEIVSLSPSPCLQRVRRLEKAGIIKRYRAEVDISRIAETVMVLTEISIGKDTLEAYQFFETRIGRYPEVVECYMASGGYDYLVKFICKNIAHYQDVIKTILDSDIGVEKYHSYVVMKEVIAPRELPLSQLTES